MTEIVEPAPPLPLKMKSSAGSMYVPVYGPVRVDDSASEESFDRHNTYGIVLEFSMICDKMQNSLQHLV